MLEINHPLDFVSFTFLNLLAFNMFFSYLLRHLQIDSDDVITRDEQIYVLIGAHARCERSIRAQAALVKGFCAAFDRFRFIPTFLREVSECTSKYGTGKQLIINATFVVCVGSDVAAIQYPAEQYLLNLHQQFI